jgi:hypothetical protein
MGYYKIAKKMNHSFMWQYELISGIVLVTFVWLWLNTRETQFKGGRIYFGSRFQCF